MLFLKKKLFLKLFLNLFLNLFLSLFLTYFFYKIEIIIMYYQFFDINNVRATDGVNKVKEYNFKRPNSTSTWLRYIVTAVENKCCKIGPKNFFLSNIRLYANTATLNQIFVTIT
jgi:hypothetical protein